MMYLTILGSTGSIGNNVLDIINKNPDKFKVCALVANDNVNLMIKQCLMFHPNYVCMINENSAKKIRQNLTSTKINIKILSGIDAACELAALEEIDTVVGAIAGIGGLLPTISAVRAGKKILLANKEILVACGKLFMHEVRLYKSFILPLDSEHNAIFQNLPEQLQNNLGYKSLIDYGISHITLTASGGPFFQMPLSNLSCVTPEQACAHPNWSMGRKISVDSATMMNKGLEYIEARWLFNASKKEIDILLHPQSIIHSMVHYINGSTLAHLSKSNMKITLAYALNYPKRISSGINTLDFLNLKEINFFPIDNKRYPCLKLAIDADNDGQSATTILNAANEVAVSAFLRREISFTDIFLVNSLALDNILLSEPNNIEDVLYIDQQAKIKTHLIIKNLKN